MNPQQLKEQLTGIPIAGQFKMLTEQFPGKVVFTTSFGMEDQVITHLIAENKLSVELVTLDTGRLFQETYKVFSETVDRYGLKIKVFFPDREEVEEMMTDKGPFSFYHSKQNRLECCRLRKVMPLARALAGREIWITGIRSGQSEERGQRDWLEYDEEKELIRFHPLFNWSLEDVENFIKERHIPYNSLHDKGFISIGCQPCTRSVKKGDDFRSGRWWWEMGGNKECGIMINNPGTS